MTKVVGINLILTERQYLDLQDAITTAITHYKFNASNVASDFNNQSKRLEYLADMVSKVKVEMEEDSELDNFP